MQYLSIFPQCSQSLLPDSSKKSTQSVKGVKFPEFLRKIVSSDRSQYGNLYIGNVQAAQNRQLLKNQMINGILSVAQDYPATHPKEVVRYFKYIPIPEGKNVEINHYLQDCAEFLSNTLLLTNILVHCVSGENRSACAVIAYLIYSKKLSFEEAYDEVKSCLKMVQLGEDIKEQLKKYELDLNNTGLRKSKYNPSVRVNTQINNNSFKVNESYFKDQISQQSVLTNKNNLNPEIATHMSKSRQSYRSKTCQDKKQSHIIINSPKVYTKQQNAEHNSLSSNKQWKSMNIILKPSSLGKYRTDKSLSKVSSIKYQSQYEFFSNKDKSSLQKQLDKPARGNHLQFIKRLNLLDNRNQEINAKYRQLQTDFDKTNEQNKLLLQSQLSQIHFMCETITKQYNQRKIKINERTKTFFSKNSKELQEFSANKSRISNSNRQPSQLK